MWRKFRQTAKNVLKMFKNMSKDNQRLDTETEECLRRLETVLNNSVDRDIQMQINGKWVSKSLMEAISAVKSEEKLLKMCHQTEALPLEQILPDEIQNRMEVLWSGCYSEVLRIKNMMGEDIVLKIALINRLNKDGLVIQTASAIVSDVINSKRLSDLKAIPFEMSDNYCENFANIKSFLYVWSNKLVFNRSEFRGRKDTKTKYEYFISQQTFGGKQLDSVISLSPTKAYSIVLQLIASLAVAEEALQFEHRDLHLSNLLLKRTEDKYLNYSIGGHKFRLKLNGIKLSIIDTTFSRTEMKVVSTEDKEVVKRIYNDLSTLNLEEYPNSELKKVYLLQKQLTANKWKEFFPKTNTIWLKYSFDKIYQKVEKWSQKHSISSESNYWHHLSQLKKIKLEVCHSNSAKEFAHICQLF